MSISLKTWFLSLCVIVCGVAGNSFLSKGIKAQDPHAAMLAIFLDPVALVGVLLLIGWMLFRMALLSISPMSALLPFVAGIGYLLISLVGQYFLHESLGKGHYLGVSLIAVGVFLIASSAAKDIEKVDP